MRIQEDAKWAKLSITETLTTARIVETASISTRQADGFYLPQEERLYCPRRLGQGRRMGCEGECYGCLKRFFQHRSSADCSNGVNIAVLKTV